MQRALQDRRRVDELVTNFEYGGVVSVPAEGQTYEGQGAVKRFLTTLLVDHEVREVALAESEGSGQLRVALNDAVGVPRDLLLHPKADGTHGLISSLSVRESSAPPNAAPLFGSASGEVGKLSGPKWETYDGRVRQRIWQHTDIFAAGNRFLPQTMELTTGRLIMIVDDTVWRLYGDKLTTWAESVNLRLDPVIAPGNENHKTLETFTYMLDELKRTDPLRRSEPVLGTTPAQAPAQTPAQRPEPTCGSKRAAAASARAWPPLACGTRAHPAHPALPAIPVR